jgi:hypothetical protein
VKKIIGGKKYDTDTAKELGYDNNIGGDILARTDFDFEESKLYRKKTGEYFIYRFGGARTPYSEGYIRPCTEEEAKAWAEVHMSVDDYETLWGEVGE